MYCEVIEDRDTINQRQQRKSSIINASLSSTVYGCRCSCFF